MSESHFLYKDKYKYINGFQLIFHIEKRILFVQLPYFCENHYRNTSVSGCPWQLAGGFIFNIVATVGAIQIISVSA